jgi:diguanylate cyclase (GGDEF)-like protein/PAS domain S-box-containing protein
MAQLLERLSQGYGLLTIALVVFTVCAFLSLGRIRAEHEVETKATAMSFWLIDQANSELQLLINALDGYAIGYLGITRQKLIDRFDIFWSRIPLLVEGPEGDRMKGFTDVAGVVPEILASLEAIEPELLELRPNDVASHRRLRDRLTQLRPALHGLLLETNRAFAVDYPARSGEFDRLYHQHLVYQIGILISAGIFILFLMREIRTATVAESRAEEARGQLQSILDAIPVRISVTDHESRLLLVNRYQRDLEGLDESRVIGRRPSEVGMGSEADDLNLRVISTGHALPQFEEMLCDRQGWERAWLTTKVPIVDGGGEVKRVLSASLDITARKAAEARLAHLALHDPLTDLPNRTLFHDRLAQELRHAERDGNGVAVMCVDLEGFKEINDAYGHGSGDALLVAVAARLRASLRRSDTIARLGGDEFAVILSDVTDPNAAVQVAENLVNVLGEPLTIEGSQLITGVSIGISLAPQDGTTPDQLLKFADLALYDAKSDHSTGFRFFHASMNQRVQRRRELQSELRRALDSQGFEVHYQPKFILPDRRL